MTFVAVVFGATAAQKQIGVGAALGGPLVLSTVAYATVGLVLICCRMRLPTTEAIRGDSRKILERVQFVTAGDNGRWPPGSGSPMTDALFGE